VKRGETLGAPSTDITERYFPLIIFLLVKCRWTIGVKAAIRWNITFTIDNHRVTPQCRASRRPRIPETYKTPTVFMTWSILRENQSVWISPQPGTCDWPPGRFFRTRPILRVCRSSTGRSTGGWHDFACGFTFRECYGEKESSFRFGRDEGGSLAGNESAIVLSSIFSRFACSSPGSPIRSSGSLRWILTMLELRFLHEPFLSFMINENSVCSGLFRRWRSRAPSHPEQRSVRVTSQT
jgi:hypothetical protein